MNINTPPGATIALFIGVILSSAMAPAAAITPAQKPLYIGLSAAKPNILLMVDNSGSMNDPVPIDPQPPNEVTGSFTCNSSYYYTSIPGASTAAGATSVIPMQVFSKSAKFCPLTGSCTSSTSRAFGSSSGRKCFQGSKYYNISNLGTYSGSQLNNFFKKYNGSFNGALNSIVSTLTRLQVAKTAAIDFVNATKPTTDSSPSVRLGLARFNGTDGGELLTAIGPLDSAKATEITTELAGFIGDSYTPLAETLSDIGGYFATGYTGSLTLNPDNSPTSVPKNTIFNNHSIKNSTGSSPLASPIQGACQQSAAIILSDGLPTEDRNISASFQDYDGDCSGTNSSNCSTYDMKNAYAYPGSNSSDYLDDVAKALYEMDLRPDLSKLAGQKNNLKTYTVGFADPAIDPTLPGANPLFKDAAVQGGGKFIYAENATTLTDALTNITSDIIGHVSASASVVANSTKLDTGSAIYQGRFDSTDWTGSLSMLPISASEDTNANGTLDSGEDVNGNLKLDGGTIGTEIWNAATKIPAFGDRNIYTYNSTASPKGVTFICDNLTASQQTALGIASCTGTDIGVWRLNYLRGDLSHEEIHPNRPGGINTDTIRSSTPADRIFRNRTHLVVDPNDEKKQIVALPDPWLLGDIANSNPAFVSNENYGYSKLPGTEGTDYKVFLNANKSRRKMVYVGANDGMLHGFDANASGDKPGQEIFAYIPNEVYSKLNSLSSPDYSHQYLVDGSPRVADAYFDGIWHTMLASTTGAGGKAVFALDITNPDSLNGNNILWEISDTISPNASDLTTDTTTVRGFANNMGYTLTQPSIVKMQDGSWVAIVANGYASANNLAVLYIIDIKTGNLIKAFDTKSGTSTTPNGLSTPIAVDSDNDKMVDVIYAGDLLGNMWKFDVHSNIQSEWKIAYGSSSSPAPLFVACTTNSDPCADANRQPITIKPQVGNVGPTQTTNGVKSGVMVYFGTGKYFEEVDNVITNAQTQTFYGIWDNNAAVSKSNLQSQSIIAEVTVNEFNLRATTDNLVDYSSKKGWYMDLLEPSKTTSTGERVISTPLLRNDRIIFVTYNPDPPDNADICGANSSVSSWLMELNGITGNRLPPTAAGAPWDINGDGMVNTDDLITVEVNGAPVALAPTGKESNVGGVNTPVIVNKGKLEYKYTSGTTIGETEVTTEQSSNPTSVGTRQSWRQIPAQ